MQMLLPSDGIRAYKYYIEVSLNEKDRTRISDHTDDFCTSWQMIVFGARLVPHIRIVETAATVGEVCPVILLLISIA